jgi:hypothetical protein
MVKNIIRVIVCLLAAVFPCAKSYGITTGELADICEAMEKYILDIRIEFEWGNDPPMTTDDIQEGGILITEGFTKTTWATKRPFDNFSLSSETARFVNRYGDSWEGTTKQSYNGKIAKHLQRGSSVREDMLSGTITKSSRFARDIYLTPAGFTVLHYSRSDLTNRTPLYETLRKEELVRLDESIRKVNGFDAIKVDILQEQTKKLWGTVYFSIEHNYSPIRYEYWGSDANGNRVVQMFYNVTSLEEVYDGVWFPKSCNRGCPDGERRDVFKVNKVSINQGLADDFFDFEFPPSTKVHDEILGMTYLLKPTEDEFEKWLEDENRLRILEKRGTGRPYHISHDLQEPMNGQKSIDIQESVVSQQQNYALQADRQEPRNIILICGVIVFATVGLLGILVFRKKH